MRELKFRVWDKKEEDWLILGATGIDCLSGKLVDYEYEGYELENQENYIIEQYTGIKDKNGNEIYEGDILRFYGRYISAIAWDDVAASYQWFAVENIGDGYCWLSDFEKDFYEVIGNIHENPELLGEKNERR